jgi:hypothetical protein
MTDEEFRAELKLFANLVEEKKAPGILVDVSSFRHRVGAEAGQGRLRNISPRYNAARVQRFALCFFKGFANPADGKRIVRGRTVPDPLIQQSRTSCSLVNRMSLFLVTYADRLRNMNWSRFTFVNFSMRHPLNQIKCDRDNKNCDNRGC